MKVFITVKIPEKGIHILRDRGYEVEIGSQKNNLSRKDLMRKAKGADAILCQLEDKINGEMLDAIGPQLKVISNYAVGYDNIDLQEASRRNVAVTNTPGVLTQAVAEHAVALVLSVARRIVEADEFIRSGKYRGFEPDLLVGMELKGKTLGIVGHGRIGCKVADIFQKGFGMRVLYYDIFRDMEAEQGCGISYASLEDLLAKSDVVSLHVPLLPETKHLIGERELSMMKPSAFLINTARGLVVDEKALVKILKEGKIAGAALDVFENEPKLASGLSKLKNVVLTPHIASATKEAREKMAEVAALNVIAVLEKEGTAFLVK
ncbi:MAG: D-glycerate dehydrogenase [Candidatus Wildermuthbacteria bacterium]|nr:D-glycerate dehydrogenase [Candidatus Wildermuthbacteria bacterium]